MNQDLKNAILQEILKEKPHLKRNKRGLKMVFNKRLKEIEKGLKFETSKLGPAKFGADFKRLASKAYVPYFTLLAELKQLVSKAPELTERLKTQILSTLVSSKLEPKITFKNEKSLLKISIIKEASKVSKKAEKDLLQTAFQKPKDTNFKNNISNEKLTGFANQSIGRIKTQTPDVINFLKQRVSQTFQKGGRPEDFLKEIKKCEGFIEKRKNHMRFIAKETFRQVNNDILNETCTQTGITDFYLIHNDNLSLDKKNIRINHQEWANSRKVFRIGRDPDPKEEPNCHCTKKWLIPKSAYL